MAVKAHSSGLRVYDPMNKTMLRVNIDDLEEDPEWIWEFFYLYKGKPFTGIAYELYANGQLGAEMEIVDGQEDGLKRIWYPSGKIHIEVYAKRYQKYSFNLPYETYTWLREWHENGILKVERFGRFGRAIKETRWNEQGELTHSFEQPEQRI